MSKITEQSVKAFRNGESFNKSNTMVAEEKDANGNQMMRMYLHNNVIAEYFDGMFFISAAGQRTKTTKERLNGFPGVFIIQKDWDWYLNREYWDGEWIEIK